MRTPALLLLTLLLATNPVTAAAVCPPASANDDRSCDAVRRSAASVTACVDDARTTETCADHTTGVTHALYQTRAASEYRKAALAAGRRTPRARRWLAHATILDERVQDDPNAPLNLRRRAKRDEEQAKAALH